MSYQKYNPDGPASAAARMRVPAMAQTAQAATSKVKSMRAGAASKMLTGQPAAQDGPVTAEAQRKREKSSLGGGSSYTTATKQLLGS